MSFEIPTEQWAQVLEKTGGRKSHAISSQPRRPCPGPH